MRLACQTNAWGGVWGDPVGVTSIKDLLYHAPGATKRAPGDIAAAGFEGVEMFDGDLLEYADRRDDLRSLLDRDGLELVGVYSGANLIYADVLEDELWRVDRAAALAEDLAAEHLVIGGGAQRSAGEGEDDFARLGAGLERVAEIAERHSLTPSYHPHMGTLAEAPDQIAGALANSSIGFCPDTAHLALGGGDPAELIREHRDRIPYVHLKDLSEDGGFVPLGHGTLDLEAIAEALREIEYGGWITVEFDGYEGDLAKAARDSRERATVLVEQLG
jgi:inosose dehydratase